MIAKMKRMGKFSNEDISEITGFTVEEIEVLAIKRRLFPLPYYLHFSARSA